LRITSRIPATSMSAPTEIWARDMKVDRILTSWRRRRWSRIEALPTPS
jgi:hypothetical protein